MALRGTLTHWKTRLLAKELGMMPCQALGILEALWHVTAELAPAGNIGRLPNMAIAMEMFYEGDPDKLIGALVMSGHLDQDAEHRLLIHDWSQHVDYNTRRKLERNNASLIGDNASRRVMTPHKSIPEPEPVPEPEPEPVKVSEAKASSPRTPSGKPDPVEAIYQAYPRRIGRGAALKAIHKAVKRICATGQEPRQAQVFLYQRVQAFARSPAGQDGEFTPYPATWFNQGRYDDDPAEWQRKANERGTSYGNSNQGRGGITGDEMSRILDSLGGSETGDPVRGDEGALFSPA